MRSDFKKDEKVRIDSIIIKLVNENAIIATNLNTSNTIIKSIYLMAINSIL